MSGWRGTVKHRAVRTNGFASKLENAVHQKLLDRQVLGEIKEIKQQCPVVLINCEECGTRVSWKVDFSFVEVSSGKTVYVEAKGVETTDYLRKLKAWKKKPPARLEIWKGKHSHLKLTEVIE